MKKIFPAALGAAKSCLAACGIVLAFLFPAAPAHGQPITDFTTYSLEDLMEIEITSAAKKPQKAAESASAVYVITQEDIRRSGAVNLPEALRMAPGIQVVRSDPGTFAVTSRGFLGKYANKLLVLVDGRSIYSPLTSGVFWSYRDMLLENIERIEVIRGPGATLWGANAVNGVINIITKHARDMQGGLGVATVSTVDEGYDGLRYGVKLKENMYLSAYAKYMHFGAVVNKNMDGRRQANGGSRLDWDMTENDKLMVSAGYYEADESGRTNRPLAMPRLVQSEISSSSDLTGGHFLSKWNHTFSPTSDISLQAYYDGSKNSAKRTPAYKPAQDIDDLDRDITRTDTYDLDLQHTFAAGSRNSIIWGLNAHYDKTKKEDVPLFYTFQDETETLKLYSAFVQDELVLVPERLNLILGSKFEYNSYTQFEIQPSIRLLYTHSAAQTIWCAVSRAARTPSVIENAGRLPQGYIKRGSLFPLSPPGLAQIQGNTDFDSEDLIAYELGHRIQLNPDVSFDTALFYNVYHGLRTLEPSSLELKRGYFIFPLQTDNSMHGRSYGAEITSNWQVLPKWRLQTSYSYLRMNLVPDKKSADTLSESDEKLSPEHTLVMRSLYALTPNLEFDVGLYFMDRLEKLSNPSHTDLTIRLGWKPCGNLMIEGIAYNLIDNKYKGFRDEIYARGLNEVRRAFYGRITVEF